MLTGAVLSSHEPERILKFMKAIAILDYGVDYGMASDSMSQLH